MVVTSYDLFQAAGGTDVLNFAPFLDRARTEREHGNDLVSRVALGAYLTARLVERHLNLSDDPDDQEGFRWQLDSTRKYLMDLESDQGEVAHLQGIIDALVSLPDHRDAVLRMALIAYAYFLEHEGRFHEALDVLTLGGRTYRGDVPVVDAATMALFMARVNRMLARWDQANHSYQMAERAGRDARDFNTVMLARIGLGNVLRGQGDLPGARAALEAVVRETRAAELADVHGRALADLSVVLERQGNLPETITARYESLLYLKDPLQRARVLGDLGIALRMLGAYDAARQCYSMVLEGDNSFILRANTCLELMELESAAGNRIAFERYRQEARTYEDRMPPSMAIDYRYKVGIGFARFHKEQRARAILREALDLAEEHRLNEWYFRVDRVLRNLELCPECEEAQQPTAETTDMVPAVAFVSAGLREMAGAGA